MKTIQIKLRKQLLKYAFNNKISHIPSSLSLLDIFYCLNKYINYSSDCLIIGKPYGLLAYNTVWNTNYRIITGYTQNILWADSTIGNCLGIAHGVLYSNKYKNIFVIFGDGVLQEGTILEALLAIGLNIKNMLSKIIIIVDYNKYQCIGKNYISIKQMKKIITSFNFLTYIIDGHNLSTLNKYMQKYILNDKSLRPLCLLCNTIKGKGLYEMENNPEKWHYKILTENEYKMFINELI